MSVIQTVDVPHWCWKAGLRPDQIVVKPDGEVKLQMDSLTSADFDRLIAAHHNPEKMRELMAPHRQRAVRVRRAKFKVVPPKGTER